MTDKPQEERSEPEVGARKPRGDESPEVEGHRFAPGPEEPGARKPRKDDESEEGEGRFPT
jgi:hypothetical protein